MQNECDVKSIAEKIEKMQKLQEAIDRKTKDAQAYKKSNEWLVSIMKFGIIAVTVFFVSCAIILGFTIVNVPNRYFDYESGIVRETVTESSTMNAGDNGVIVNKSSGNTATTGAK